MSTVNNIFYIKGNLDHLQRRDLESRLSSHNSISSVAFNRARKHLLCIVYDPDVWTAQDLLQFVSQSGVQASSVYY